jgi:hypothetical protein
MNKSGRLLIALLLVNLGSLSNDSFAGEEHLGDLQNAKVAHAIAKQRMMSSQKTKEEREADSDEEQTCGSVDIGNVRNERGAMAPREIITVVKGDVINTGTCR